LVEWLGGVCETGPRRKNALDRDLKP